jgi:deoxycytidylate deaminase
MSEPPSFLQLIERAVAEFNRKMDALSKNAAETLASTAEAETPEVPPEPSTWLRDERKIAIRRLVIDFNDWRRDGFPTDDEVCLAVAQVVAAASIGDPVGAVVVKAGVPLGWGCSGSVHAAVNAVLNAEGSCRGGTLYITKEPCSDCLKVIDRAGIAQVRVVGD